MQTLSACNEAVIRSKTEAELFSNICEVITHSGGYRMAWVGTVQHDINKSILPVAKSGFEDGYLESANLTWAEYARGQGPGGLAIRNLQPAIIRDVQTDERFAPWREQATSRGYASVIGLPLIEEGVAFGVLLIYASENDAFDSDEVSLLVRLSDNLAFGVTAIRNRLERRTTEQALKASEESLRETQHITHLGSWVWSKQTSEMRWSDEIFLIFGFLPVSIKPSFETLLAIVQPRDRQVVMKAIENTRKHYLPLDIEFRVERRDVGERTVIMRGHVHFDDNGRLSHIMGTIQDISEQTSNERQLLLQRAVLESTDDAVLITDGEGVIEWANSATERVTGYALDEMVGQTPRLLKSGSQSEAFYNQLWGVITTGESWQGEMINRRKDGALYHEEQTITPVINKRGEITHFVAIKRDVSKRKAMEREQREVEKQLKQAQKMEAIGQLTGGIAHDFNNILASIMGYTSLALARFTKSQDESSNKLAEYLNRIDQASRRARDLIAQMLAFSRAGTSEPRSLPAAPLVKEAISLLRSTIPSNITIALSLDEDLPPINFDPIQFHQVIMNLCINARDAIAESGCIDVKLNLTTIVNDSCASCQSGVSGDYVELSVSDSGSGIDPENLMRVFDPFFTTKEVGKGSGMGLSMVHGIVHEYGGHILVNTKPEGGTDFRVLVPASAVNDSEELSVPTQSIVDGVVTPARILLVNDDHSVAGFIAELLESIGYQVVVTTEEKQIVDSAREQLKHIDLLIADYAIPGMTGVELAKDLRQQREDLPVLILCSGNSEQPQSPEWLENPLNGFVRKPIDNQLLLSTIRKLLDGDD
ncbi:hybrid sensor histidine kinase/response regulator [Solemya pervernicosa gill symbiont]|uniref:hybrid sensor histidine kinase/response regulator n=1 Tax=Solemya pervernicosa gill symbiont TaxID=642797 RepID=UPI001082346E|nr:PAS domain S-box protein [Solemya pervernicosa gill symbiont]